MPGFSVYFTSGYIPNAMGPSHNRVKQMLVEKEERQGMEEREEGRGEGGKIIKLDQLSWSTEKWNNFPKGILALQGSDLRCDIYPVSYIVLLTLFFSPNLFQVMYSHEDVTNNTLGP